jgi:hypothetical protein
MTKILKFIQVSLLIFGLFLVLVPASSGNVVVHAANGVNEACERTKIKKKLIFTDIIYIGKFLPLIPEECGIADDGNINPLPFSFIFDLIIRLLGFLFSLAFYLLPVAIIVYGGRVLFVAFDPSLNKSEFQEVTTIGRTITRELGQFVTGLIIILFSYTIVFTILGTLQIESNTDLSSFFSFGSN